MNDRMCGGTYSSPRAAKMSVSHVGSTGRPYATSCTTPFTLRAARCTGCIPMSDRWKPLALSWALRARVRASSAVVE